MTSYIPRHEQKTGANLSGSSGDEDRTIVLTNSNAVFAQMQIIVAQAILQPTVDYTLTTSSNTVTFLNKVWNDQTISIDYFTITTVVAPTGDNYCTTLDVVRFSGLGVVIELETLGTGDDSERSFDANYGNIIDGSYVLCYGAADNNDTTDLVDVNDYTINKNAGTIYLTAAGLAKLSTNVLYISYTYSPKQSDTILETYLPGASREVEKLTNDIYSTSTSKVEFFDGYDSGYVQTDMPHGEQIDKLPEFMLLHKGVLSITSVEFLDSTGAVENTVDSDYISFSSMGRVILTEASVPNGKRNVKITYAQGYTSIPSLIAEATALLAGMMALVNISGGSYKDISTYQVGRKSFSIGQIYINIDNSIGQMRKRLNEIVKNMGFKYACA